MAAEKYILFAEDDEDDRYLFKSAFKEVDPSVDVVFVSNVIELKQHFLQIEKGSVIGKPSLVVLDIHIPINTGNDIVKDVLRRSYAREIPAVLLTSTDCELELKKRQELKCYAAFQKPKDNQTLIETLVAIKSLAKL